MQRKYSRANNNLKSPTKNDLIEIELNKNILYKKTVNQLPKIYGIQKVIKRRADMKNNYSLDPYHADSIVMRPCCQLKQLKLSRQRSKIKQKTVKQKFYKQLVDSIDKSSSLDRNQFENYSKRYSKLDESRSNKFIISKNELRVGKKDKITPSPYLDQNQCSHKILKFQNHDLQLPPVDDDIGIQKPIENSIPRAPRQKTQQKMNNQYLNTDLTKLSLDTIIPSQSNSKNTFFLELIKKQPEMIKNNSRKNSHAIQNIYKIPNKQELPDYIKKYKSLDISFDLRELSNSSKFKIIPFKTGLYIGEFQNDKRHGLGIFITQKSIFQGEFIQNLKNKGSQSTHQGIYKGNYSNGLRDGKGQFKWNNGQNYVGQWKNGMKHGNGTWKSPTGDYYTGQWISNRQEGFGTHLHQNIIYKGQFKNFLKHGKGQEIFPNGDRYKGEYSQGKANGQGQYFWKNGDYYIGSFRNGVRQGQGIMKEGQITYKVAQVNLKMILKPDQVKYKTLKQRISKKQLIKTIKSQYKENKWLQYDLNSSKFYRYFTQQRLIIFNPYRQNYCQ